MYHLQTIKVLFIHLLKQQTSILHPTFVEEVLDDLNVGTYFGHNEMDHQTEVLVVRTEHKEHGKHQNQAIITRFVSHVKNVKLII